MRRGLWILVHNADPAALAGQINLIRCNVTEGLVQTATIVELRVRDQGALIITLRGRKSAESDSRSRCSGAV